MKGVSYSDKVKKASTVIRAIKGLKVGESINILYDSNTYKIEAYSAYGNKIAYSVWNNYNGMNVSKVGRTSLTLYSYDMMTTKTTYRMSLVNASILPESVDVAA